MRFQIAGLYPPAPQAEQPQAEQPQAEQPQAEQPQAERATVRGHFFSWHKCPAGCVVIAAGGERVAFC